MRQGKGLKEEGKQTKTYPTLEAVRSDTPVAGVVAVAQIEHQTDGRCFVRIKCSVDYLRAAVQRNPRGEVIRVIEGYDYLESPKVPTSEIQRHCERCHIPVPESAYCQQEWTRFGGQRVQVTAWYCDACRQLLATVGAGERTEMESRAGQTPSYEPYTKTDY